MSFVGRRFLAGVLFFALSIPLASCGGGGGEELSTRHQTKADETPTRGGVISRHLESDCKTLNWVLFNTKYENYVLRYLYDYLLDYDEIFRFDTSTGTETAGDNILSTVDAPGM